MNQEKHIIDIKGMTCGNCALGVEQHLKSKGIIDVNVSISTNQAIVFTKDFTKKELSSFILELGYSVTNDNNVQKYSNEEKLFLFCLIFTIPLFLHMFLKDVKVLQDPLVQFFLCLPVYLVGTWFFGISAIKSIKNRFMNMNVLITIGSSAAFFYSVYGWQLYKGTEHAHNFLFFETSATIITLVLLGNVLEKRSVKQTTTSINELSDIRVEKAKIERDNKIIEVEYENIKRGDILLVNTGDKIAVDGKIINGDCTIDESMITGESVPVLKTKEDLVIGGTVLISGTIKVLAEKVGNETLLSNIIELVRNAHDNKPKIQKFGDKISSVFVPFVLIFSILTFFISHYILEINELDSFLRSIAVLVISCPCAMGLATPTAVMVGIGRAARNGILIKGGSTLERFANVDHILFDKTGTITNGRFKISHLDIIANNNQYIKDIIYSLETHSSHPIALSIVNELSDSCTKLNIDNVVEKQGVSISGVYEGSVYEIGSKRILRNKTEVLHDLYVLKDKKIVAIIDLEDDLKNNITEVINEINSKNISTTLLSGDRKEKCLKIANKISFHNIYSEQLPQDKLNRIKSISASQTTAMIGDGVNDAPALSQSSVGVAVGGSTQIAIESADIILLNKNDLQQLNQAIQISRHTLTTIKQNLFWAFSYNIVAIPIAAMGYLNPMWGALFMAFSDIIVIGNSIRLKYKKLY